MAAAPSTVFGQTSGGRHPAAAAAAAPTVPTGARRRCLPAPRFRSFAPCAAAPADGPLSTPSPVAKTTTPRGRDKPSAAAAAASAAAAPVEAARRPGAALPDLLGASLQEMTSGTFSLLPRHQGALDLGSSAADGGAAALLLCRGDVSEDYAFGELLGRGTFGEVRAATHRATGQRRAVKVLAATEPAARAAAHTEAEFAARLQACQTAARLHAVYEDASSVYLVQELCAGGDIASMATAAGGRLSETEAASVVLGVLRFLAHAHARGICYGDVKPENFVLRALYPCIDHLIDPSAPKGPIDVCAVDFGCCQQTEPDMCLPDVSVSGTPAYLAPEAFNQCFGMPSDVWATGVMLHHLLSGGFPFWVGPPSKFHAMTSAQLRDGIVKGSPMFTRDPWAAYLPSVKDLICKMLEKDPSRRLTAAAAAAHPWFAEVLGPSATPAAAALAAVRQAAR